MDLEKVAEDEQLFLEEENDLNLINTTSVRRKVFDSDSENDEVPSHAINDVPEKESLSHNNNPKETECSAVEPTDESTNEILDKLTSSNVAAVGDQNTKQNFKKKPKRIAIIDSDSEDELNSELVPKVDGEKESIDDQDNYLQDINDKETVKKNPKRIAIIDSESEDEPITPHNKSFNDELDKPLTSNKEASVFIVNAKGNLVEEDTAGLIQKSRFSALCDSESSEDESKYPSTSAESPQTNRKRPSNVRKTNKPPKEKPSGKAMTGKQAQQQRQEIRSESQRMLRESRVSLPYHKPKAHSIKEFLQNRPRLSLSLVNANNTPPSVAMKMSLQQLEIVTKKLEERGKAVQEFYRSESESEEEEVNNEKTADENTEIGIMENVEVVENNENRNPIIDLEEKSKESAEVVNLAIEHVVEANSDGALTMEVDGDISQIKDIDQVKEKEEEEISATTDLTEEVSHDITNTELMNESETNNIENVSNNCEAGSDNIPIASPKQLENSPLFETMNHEKTEESNKEIPSVIDEFEDSVDFDFNLDDLEDDESSPILEKISKSNTEEQHLQRLLKKYEDTPVTSSIKSVTAITDKINKTDFLKQFGSSKPSLSGGPDEVIDLDEGVTKPSGVAQLMERFMKHALTKSVVKNKVQLDIINLTQGEVIKETVAMAVDPEEEPVVVLEKPGLKLKRLRDELQSQMAQRRSELWQQKHQPLGENSHKDPYDGEKSDCGADDDILDDEEEVELSDIEDEEEEEQYEEEVRKTLEKPRVKSAFIEDEAEETDEEECEKASEDEVEDAAEKDSNEVESTGVKKPLRRIIKGFTEDSDEEEDSESAQDSVVVENNNAQNKSVTSLNTTDSLIDDDHIPPNQPRTDNTPHKEQAESKNAMLGLLTPIQHLTGLQGFNSGSKFLDQESPTVESFLLPPDPSPFRDKKWNRDLQKKLFSDSSDTFDSQGNMDDLEELCSGKFPTQTQAMPRAESACSNNALDNFATQDVIGMCSGSFPDMTQASKNNPERHFVVDENASDETKTVRQLNLNSTQEIKSLDDDRFISQLLDEEEMELFKKKFESPIADTLTNLKGYETDTEVQGGGRLVSDSSSDEAEEPKNKKYTKKLQKRLAFSDDSDSEDEPNEDREEIKLHDDCFDDEPEAETNQNKLIDYDSEENEIELDDQEDAPKLKLNINDFMENEAELTESEWDSADEDEKGLDALEFEQGDADVFDENKMRNDLEKIHMRRILDQDNQEIKILQEMLLEDGELHGTGRQRQFRWRNMDDGGNDDGEREAGIEAYLDEDESEEQWRRARHQREMFLKEKEEKHSNLGNDDFISTDSNSQVLKFGQEAVRKSLSATSTVLENPKATTSSPEIAKPLMLMNKRGSFLARTDNFLSKLAEYTKVTTTTTGGVAKTTKKIVFQAVSTEIGILSNKRKLENEDKTPKILKKLRLSSNLTPVVKNVDRKKKLFK